MVLKIKKQKKPIKIGHTGTLDKAAEGLMILPFGDYTSFSSVFLEEDKSYFARVSFGKSTDSGDREGNVLEEWNSNQVEEFFLKNESHIKEEIVKILETKIQIPPVISALKVGGKRQSSLFREGVAFESVGRNIEIYSLEYTDLSSKGFSIKLKVSSGTYIRKIVIDLGGKLGLPMYMEKLVRTSIGKNLLESALTLEEVLTPDSKFYTLPEMIDYPWIDLDEIQSNSVRHGNHIPLGNLSNNFFLRDPSGNLLAWGTLKDKKDHLPYKYVKVFYNSNEK